MQRELNFAAMANARDLGGLRTANGSQTRWRSLVRADSAARLTQQGVRAIVEYGVRTVIDLRFPVELRNDPSPFAARTESPSYVSCSLLGESWQSWILRGATPNDTYWYSSFLDCSQSELRRVMGIIADAPEGGVLFHCTAGKDRTGVVAMLLLALADVPDESIIDDYALTAPSLIPQREKELAEASDPMTRARIEDGFRCEPQFAAHTLAHLQRRYGGAEGYMRTIGMNAQQIGKLRRRLV